MGTHEWYCVQCKPRKEEFVLSQFLAADVPVYRPLLLAPGRRGTRVVPLFPSYVFVQIRSVEESVTVRYTPGVRSLLGSGDSPTPVGEAIIQLIREREGDDGFISPSQMFEFRPEQRVLLRGGALDGLEALFQHYMPGRQRLEVLLTLLGRQVAVQVSAESVVPVPL